MTTSRAFSHFLVVVLSTLMLAGCATVSERHETNDAVIISDCAIEFYRRFITTQDDSSCVFSPSCSLYFRDAVRSYGLEGALMGVDRLTRCNPFNLQYSDDYSRTADGLLIDPVPERE